MAVIEKNLLKSARQFYRRLAQYDLGGDDHHKQRCIAFDHGQRLCTAVYDGHRHLSHIELSDGRIDEQISTGFSRLQPLY